MQIVMKMKEKLFNQALTDTVIFVAVVIMASNVDLQLKGTVCKNQTHFVKFCYEVVRF